MLFSPTWWCLASMCSFGPLTLEQLHGTVALVAVPVAGRQQELVVLHASSTREISVLLHAMPCPCRQRPA